MSATLVKLGDDVSDRLADAGDFGKSIFSDEFIERNGQGRHAVGGARVGFCPVGLPPRKAVRCAYSRRRLATVRASREAT
jgi:hypothetical protein